MRCLTIWNWAAPASIVLGCAQMAGPTCTTPVATSRQCIGSWGMVMIATPPAPMGRPAPGCDRGATPTRPLAGSLSLGEPRFVPVSVENKTRKESVSHLGGATTKPRRPRLRGPDETAARRALNPFDSPLKNQKKADRFGVKFDTLKHLKPYWRRIPCWLSCSRRDSTVPMPFR